MDRNQFIAQLFLMFPRNFTEENAATWRRAYEQVLPVATDFDSLMNTVLTEYENASIPKPAWFKDKREIKEKISRRSRSAPPKILRKCFTNGKKCAIMRLQYKPNKFCVL